MRKISLVLALILCLTCLAGCGRDNMKQLYNANTLASVFKNHTSFTLTTTMADGSSFSRFYQPNFAYFYNDEKQTVYLSSGCYSYSDGKFYTELYLREDYSFHMLKERFTAPLVAESAKVSTVLEKNEENELLTVRTRPTDAYTKLLYEEYGITEGKFEVVYVVNKESHEFAAQQIYLDGELFADITVEYDLPRPDMAANLYSRLTAPANQCRTVKVTLDPHHSNQRSVVGRTLKGDSFKLDVPEGYKSAFGNHQCTIPYQSKGADKDAEIYLVYGQ